MGEITKKPFLYPNVLKSVRDLLMDQVAKGNGVEFGQTLMGRQRFKIWTNHSISW